MKTSSFLMFAGASLALFSCQQQSQTTPPVEAPSVKVTTDKNVSDLAPVSMARKTITFRYDNIEWRHIDVAEINTAGPWQKCPAQKPETYTFKNGNIRNFKVDVSDRNALISQEYKKTGRATAKLEAQYGGGVSTYQLTFTSPNSGTAKQACEHGCNIDEIVGITFTIK